MKLHYGYNLTAVLFFAMLSTVPLKAQDGAIPFPDAVRDAAVVQSGSLDFLENALILGNGDINALLASRMGNIQVRLTKNDVIDARVDTSQDLPPIKIDVKNQKIIGTLQGIGPSWDNPYPTPRVCAILHVGPRENDASPDSTGNGQWRNIRAMGVKNEWNIDGPSAVMSLEGSPGASCGFQFAPIRVNTLEYHTVEVTLSGSENARFFVELNSSRGNLFSSGWIDTPQEIELRSFELPQGQIVSSLTLYTWSKDGRTAENRFESIRFISQNDALSVDLRQEGEGRVVFDTELDILRAVATVKKHDPQNSASEHLTFRALAQENVFLLDTPLEVTLEGARASYLPPFEEGETEGVVWIRQHLPADTDWKGMDFAVALASCEGRHAAAIFTSLETGNPLDAAVKAAKEVLQKEESSLIETHESLWREFWSKSGILLSDKEIEKLWYRNLYFFRCVSKPGVEAVGLFAGLVDDAPYWHGGHTLNYNAQQTFWSAYNCNHLELAQPYERLIFEYMPRARWLCRYTFGFDGAYIPHNIFNFENVDPETCQSKHNRMHIVTPWGYTLGVTGHAVQNLWFHYKYAPDREYLENIAWPVFRDCALFYTNFIENCPKDLSGKALFGPTVSPEHSDAGPSYLDNINCPYDIAFAMFTLKAATEAGRELDASLAEEEKAFVKRFEKALSIMPDYPVFTPKEGQTVPGRSQPGDGQAIVVDLLGKAPEVYNIAVPITPVSPGDQVTWFSADEEKELFIRTLRGILWNGNNSGIMIPVAHARLGTPEAYDVLKREALSRQRPNGTLTLAPIGMGNFNDCGHYTEQFAVSGAVSEFLLQSPGDAIRLFPAIPEGMDAGFVNLRAEGGFLISARQKGNRLEHLEVHATVGGLIRIQVPWATVQAKCGMKTLELTANSKGVVELKSEPGEVWVFADSAF
ncbi:MAG: hypothetical protein FWH27_09600 [Planctomycetaceae bacterium]|nr:hypothetical protein [Planctomycetaceae bacterium]